MSNKKPITTAFTNMASRYEEAVDTELNGFWGWRYEEFISTLLENSTIHADDIVLDVATGTGLIPERLIKNETTTLPIHGIDITMEMLLHARRRFARLGLLDRFVSVCADAMQMPYKNGSFSFMICGLATHHMSVEKLLQEGFRILQKGGRLSIADAGGAPSWRVPGAKLLLRLAAFIYFSLSDDFARAWIEAGAVTNVRTKDEWFVLLSKIGFTDISIDVLKSKHNWISAPLCIRAIKSGGEST
jgi:ubiquinone/menaquinone biosynthesis C-methylase UbiE